MTTASNKVDLFSAVGRGSAALLRLAPAWSNGLIGSGARRGGQHLTFTTGPSFDKKTGSGVPGQQQCLRLGQVSTNKNDDR